MPPGPGSCRREVTGRLAVLRDGGGLLLDERRQALLAFDPDRLADSGAMNGDTVEGRPIRRHKPHAATGAPAGAAKPAAPPGVVVRVIERAHPSVVGTFHRAGRREWVTPDDRRLPEVAVRGGTLDAEPDEKVVVAISVFPRAGDPEPKGAVVERLGAAGEPDTETLAIIRSLGLRETFPPEVSAEAEKLPREVRAGDAAGRLDLTARTVFTIDDADARDLDDAISLEESGRGAGWRLGVHIADVGHYVNLGSALDREAHERGTSVYLADRVLPMFPTALSNGIASLHPGVDRLTVSVFMEIDKNGRVVGSEVCRSVIRSTARLTYDAVLALLVPESGEVGDTRSALPAMAPPVASVLRRMAPLAEALRRRRMDRGSLDFDLLEEKAKLDGQGRPLAVVRRPSNVATQLIEEFMVVANETVADYLLWNGVPFIRRVHEDPFPDDLVALREMLAPLGYRVPTARSPRPADLQAILQAARGRPESSEVSKALLRALPQARYSASAGGHFALASPNYTHFTSPIRRYPDLTVHRQVGAVLDGTAHVPDSSKTRPEPPAPAPMDDWLAGVAAASSKAERVAERAEKESLGLMKALLARASLGAIEEGEVVDVFPFGAFVRLPNGAEGLVGAAAGGRDLRLGQQVTVQVVRADVASRHVDLHLTRRVG